MATYYYDKEIPAPLTKKIVSLSLSKVGLYNGDYHKFIPKGFSPDMSTYAAIEPELVSFGFNKEDVGEIVRLVLGDVGTEASTELVSSLDLAGDNELPVLTHVEFHEANNGVTEILYLGEQRFYVMSTNRSTLMLGNIIKAREIPLNINKVWNFDIYENFDAKKPSVPEGYKKYQAWFQTTEVVDIIVYSSPMFFSIIDENETFGGKLKKTPAKVSGGLSRLIEEIKKVVSYLKDVKLPYNEQFPEYVSLLTTAKGCGISTYTLNTLVEHIERRETKEYASTESDWHVYMTKEQIEEKEEQEAKKNKARYTALMKAVDKELTKIHRRKVALFFDADGVITEESKKHLDNIRTELDALADKGFGTKGDADSKIKTALDNSKKRPRHNFKVVMYMLGVLAVLIFVGYSWKTASDSLEKFDAATETIQSRIEAEDFNQAKTITQDSKDAFKPGYLKFIVARKTHLREYYIEESIDNFVDERVNQIETLIKANRGRIDSFTWDLVVGAMEYRPDDARLNEFRDKYVKQ